jgi:hypothetical protein
MYGQFSPEVRFQHTLESLKSIKNKIPNAKILFVDNSNMPIKDEWKKIIESQVEIFHQMQHNLFSLVANIRVGTKSESEANMLYTAFSLLKHYNLLGKRIFKISGRYKIADTFDITHYERPELENKYTFVVAPMASSEDNWITRKKVMWLEQALISFTPANVDEFQNILLGAIAHMRRTCDCIEETLFYYIPHENIVPIKKAHVYGLKAEGSGVVDH